MDILAALTGGREDIKETRTTNHWGWNEQQRISLWTACQEITSGASICAKGRKEWPMPATIRSGKNELSFWAIERCCLMSRSSLQMCVYKKRESSSQQVVPFVPKHFVIHISFFNYSYNMYQEDEKDVSNAVWVFLTTFQLLGGTQMKTLTISNCMTCLHPLSVKEALTCCRSSRKMNWLWRIDFEEVSFFFFFVHSIT